MTRKCHYLSIAIEILIFIYICIQVFKYVSLYAYEKMVNDVSLKDTNIPLKNKLLVDTKGYTKEKQKERKSQVLQVLLLLLTKKKYPAHWMIYIYVYIGWSSKKD